MLNSTEHEILNARKYKIPRNSVFLGSDKPRMLFCLLMNVKMPTIVGSLTFISRKHFMLSCVEHGFFMTSGPDAKSTLIHYCVSVLEYMVIEYLMVKNDVHDMQSDYAFIVKVV